MRHFTRLVLAAAFSLTAFAVAAHDYKVGELKIDHPWARATPGAIKTGAVYFSVTAQGDTPDRLVAVETPRAAKAEMHTQIMDGDVMKMRPVTAIEVNPGEPTVLKPGGLHIMLIGLTQPMREKERFPMTLTFEKAGQVEVQIAVEAAGARDAGHGEHTTHGM